MLPSFYGSFSRVMIVKLACLSCRTPYTYAALRKVNSLAFTASSLSAKHIIDDLPRNNPLIDHNTLVWGHARVGHLIGELPNKSIEAASQCLAERSGHHRDEIGPSVMDFFDNAARRCNLCESPITTTYQAHIGRHDHQARLGILERALALIHAFARDLNSSVKSGEKGNHSLQQKYIRATSSLNKSPISCQDNKMLFCQLRTPESLLELDKKLLQQGEAALLEINFVESLIGTWWGRLNFSVDANAVDGVTKSNAFQRLPSLSSSSAKERLWRLRFLLPWLKKAGVLQSSLSIANSSSSPEVYSRSQRFEVLEMVGDSVVKVELPDRLTRLFPHGVCSRLALFQRLIDSNPGLLAIYDWLKLDQIIGVKLANSKSKADVVECIFGELQCFLWATEVKGDPINSFSSNPSKDMKFLRSLVMHTMQELMTAIFMWRIESTLRNASAFIQGHGLELVRQRSFSTAGKKPKCVVEKDIDRGRYDTLPLVTKKSRSSVIHSLPAREAWFYSTHLACTRADPEQTVFSFLNGEPIIKPKIFSLKIEEDGMVVPKDAGAFQKQIEEARKSYREKEVAFCPSKCGLTYSRWRVEEVQSMERQQIRESIRPFLYTDEEMKEMILSQFKELQLNLKTKSNKCEPISMPDFFAQKKELNVHMREAENRNILLKELLSQALVPL